MKYRYGRQPVVGLADADRVREQYETWKEGTAEPGRVELFGTPGLDEPELATGYVTIDPERALVRSEVYGLVEKPVELWLVDNLDLPDSNAAPEADDRYLNLGSYDFEDGVAMLEVVAGDLVDEAFEVDLILVTPEGGVPFEGSLLDGVPTLFQRLYSLEERLEREAQHKQSSLLSLGVVALQSGGVPTGFPAVFSDLATRGEDLFFNETFSGNGRTCGSCHFAVNNFTIDAPLLATLRPSDPLFLAEFSPPHIFGNPANVGPDGKPRRFENPALMRAFGLITENLDGFGDLQNRFTMRGVPHNIGMSVSVTPQAGTPVFPDGPDHRTGWSGDGAPFGTFSCGTKFEMPEFEGGGGTTSPITVRGRRRDFALGAVIQHFPKTLNRNFCGTTPDFRLPNDGELDAFEAFLVGIGRTTELNINDGAANELILSDTDAETGKVLFRDADASGNAITCNLCHTNMGANPGFAANTNANINTNVERFIQNRLNDPAFTVVGEPRPIDGGFGLNPSGTFTGLIPGPGNGNENFGNNAFNTVSLVEAADSAPFFHANSAFTVEESIEFYASDEFAAGGNRIVFTTAQRDQVAAFMRAVNALDNIENLAAPRATKAKNAILISNPNANDVISFLLEVAIADTTDAIDVLNASNINNSGGLSVNAVKQLERANNRFRQAQNSNPPDSVRISKIDEGLAALAAAVDLIRVNP